MTSPAASAARRAGSWRSTRVGVAGTVSKPVSDSFSPKEPGVFRRYGRAAGVVVVRRTRVRLLLLLGIAPVSTKTTGFLLRPDRGPTRCALGTNALCLGYQCVVPWAQCVVPWAQ